ncbi:hypothetical protein BV25DRAFT_1804216 [Artomyces pyxidatus]|uniref:Uncharacterized protein n=1 Tax=Artomyces pyxidatus TaxID=48021 RepID=A0ACB8T0M8_9AGAM|nr:hypothetical protein BV25DRAFT_1804216 [Artomyces pyxidatus]
MADKKFKVKRHHGFAALIFVLGTLFPPLAVAARFGIGGDFWLNLFLTIAGYIPGHVHNFYIQNIRNNKNHARTPKWAQRYGLVNTDKIKRNAKRSQWASRYDERLPQSALEGQPLEEGQEPGASSVSVSSENAGPRRNANGQFWSAEEESYYGQQRNGDAASQRSSGRWHYPANFDDAAPAASGTLKKKKKKDRWARTEDAYSLSEETQRKKKKKRSKRTNTEDDTYSRTSGSTTELPEDPTGGVYSGGERSGAAAATSNGNGRATDETIFTHEF